MLIIYVTLPSILSIFTLSYPMSEGELNLWTYEEDIQVGEEVLDQWKSPELEQFTVETAVALTDIPEDLKWQVITDLSTNLAWLDDTDKKIIEEWFWFLPHMNLSSLALGDKYVPLHDPLTPAESDWVARIQRALANRNTKEALIPLLDAGFTKGKRDIQTWFGEFAALSQNSQRWAYMPAMSAAPWSRDQLQLTFSLFTVSPYTNIPDLQNNGWIDHGYGGTLGIQQQNNAFRSWLQLSALWTGQETDATHYYKSTAWFATGTIGLGTPSGNRIALNADIWAGVWFSAVEWRFDNKKIDETNWMPVVTWNISLDIQLFQRFMREKFKLSIGTWFIAPIWPNADSFEWVKWNWAGGRWFLGIGSDIVFIPLVATVKVRLEPRSRGGGKRSKYFTR